MSASVASIGIRVLEGVFEFGIVGSAIVVVIVTVQDLMEVFEPDREPPRESEG